MDDIKLKALESLLRRLNKSEQDYSDIPEDVIQSYSDFESNKPYSRGMLNNDAWHINRAKRIKDAEIMGNLKPYDESNSLLPENVLDNYKQTPPEQLDRLQKFLRLQDVLKK